MGVLAAELKRRFASLVVVRSCAVNVSHHITLLFVKSNIYIYWELLNLTTETDDVENSFFFFTNLWDDEISAKQGVLLAGPVHIHVNVNLVLT